MYRLYVIPGSHACRAAMLMLEHKRVPYRRVDFVTLTHPVLARLHGFDAGGQTRVAGRRRTLGIRLGDRLGTVPGLAAGKRRISTNHGIARFLDEQHPDPPLFPADPERRREVEEAERWANETLQMAARRILGIAAVRDPAGFSRSVGDGRMGHLLYRRPLVRRLVMPRILGPIFAVDLSEDEQLRADLRAMLDRIDGWIERGVLGGPQLNAADFMVAPSLALILYRDDVRREFEGRPALELVDRLLPEPATPMLEGLLAAFNAHDLDAIMSFFAEDCVMDMPRGPAPGGRRLVGKDQVREGIRSRLEGIPDVHYGDDRHWACGDRGVSEWTIRGTQATGERIEVRGCDLFELTDGKVSRKDSFWKIVD